MADLNASFTEPSFKRFKVEEIEENIRTEIKTESNVDQVVTKEELNFEDITVKEEIVEEEKSESGGTLTQTNRMFNEIHKKKSTSVSTSGKLPETEILQFHIQLLRGRSGAKIWRRFQIPGHYTFQQFHIAIQKVMGWKSVEYNYHLHAFRVLNPSSGFEDDIVIGEDVGLYGGSHDESKVKVVDYFNKKGQKARYVYDFGIGWEHEIIFERNLEPMEGEKYPKCVAGARACPPEDGIVHSNEDYDSDAFNADGFF